MGTKADKDDPMVVPPPAELLRRKNAKIAEDEARKAEKYPVFYVSHKEFDEEKENYLGRGIDRPGWYFFDQSKKPHGPEPTEEDIRELLEMWIQAQGRVVDAAPPKPWERSPGVAVPPPPAPAAQPADGPQPPVPADLPPGRPARDLPEMVHEELVLDAFEDENEFERETRMKAEAIAAEAKRLQQIMIDRGQKYGDKRINHEGIGKMYTGLLESHYQMRLPHPVPGFLVALMTACIKLNREAFCENQDNIDDAKNYLDISKACR